MGFLATIIVGVLAGWLAEKVMKVDMPTWQNLLLGLCGSALGSVVLGVVGMNKPAGMISGILVAFIFACLIVWAVNKIRPKVTPQNSRPRKAAVLSAI